MWYRIILNFPVVFYDKYLVFYNYDAENRAMNKLRPLKYFLPYYVDKYEKYKGNKAFYRFIHRWSAVIIKDYYFNKESQRDDAKVASKRLDYSVLPKKYKFLFKTPFCIGKLIYFATELRLRCKK